MSKNEPTDVVPSGYGEISKRRAAAEMAQASTRKTPPKTARGRLESTKPKKGRVCPLGPTAERLAKGDVVKTGGVHRSIPPVEKLRDQGKLDHDARTNLAMYFAAEKLKGIYIRSHLSGVQAQDLNKIHGSGDTEHAEVVEHNRKLFAQAKALMGWFPEAPHQGNGRIVIAVVCEEMGVFDAAAQHIGSGKTTNVIAAGMDRLRQGLFCLAVHWKFSR